MEFITFLVGLLFGGGLVMFIGNRFINAHYVSNGTLKKELDKEIPRRCLYFKSVTLTKGNGDTESIDLEVEFHVKEESEKRVKIGVDNVKTGGSGRDHIFQLVVDMFSDSWLDKKSTDIEWLNNTKMDNRRRVIKDILGKKK